MKKFFSISAITVLLVASPAAFAWTWVQGQGETIDEALTNAVKVAEARVKSRKSGCVDGKQRNLEKKTINETTVWSVEVKVHNQNGSCGIDANKEWVKSTASSLAKGKF